MNRYPVGAQPPLRRRALAGRWAELALGLVVSLCCVLAPAAAGAAEPVALGRRGQWLVGGAASGSAGVVHASLNGDAATTWTLALAPRAGVFVTDLIYVGLDAGLSVASGPQQFDVGAALGPLGGVHLALGGPFSFLPALSLAYGYTSIEVLTIATPSHQLTLGLLAPFVVGLGHGVGITFGPALRQGLVHTIDGLDAALDTRFTLEAGILGWL